MNLTPTSRLENLDKAELLQTVRQLLAEADALSSRISAVNEIGVAINRTLDLTKIQRVIAKQAKWLLDFEHCSVILRENDEWHARLLFGPEEPAEMDLLETDNVGHVLRLNQPNLILNGAKSAFLSRYASQIIIPLAADETLLGTVNFAATKPNSYTHDDMRIGYMLSLQLSSAIRNAQLMEELRRTQEELHLRVEELDAYSHTIAHDLKSPLSSVLLRAELINMKFAAEMPPMALRMVQDMGESGKVMHRMIDQLLMLAKLRHADATLTIVKIPPILEAVLARFPHSIEQNKIQVEIAPDLPAALGHAQWIEEIFANLISNAIKYMGDENPAPHIWITGNKKNGCVCYQVRDNGVGIAPDDQQRIFEMFTRLHDVRAEGLGLGLSIVLRILRRLGGEIGVNSIHGEGSTFWFTLPAPPEPAAAAVSPPVLKKEEQDVTTAGTDY